MELKMNTEELCNNKYQIFCDLDGVLVDLIQGVEKAIRSEAPTDASERYVKKQQLAKEALGQEILSECHLNKDDPVFKKPVRDFMFNAMNSDRHFWMNLPWMKDGKKLWDFIKAHDPIILS